MALLVWSLKCFHLNSLMSKMPAKIIRWHVIEYRRFDSNYHAFLKGVMSLSANSPA